MERTDNSIPDDVVTWLTRRGIYAIAMGDEAMQVLNLDAVRGRPGAFPFCDDPTIEALPETAVMR